MNSWESADKDQPTEIPISGANAEASITRQGGEVSQTPVGGEMATPEQASLALTSQP